MGAVDHDVVIVGSGAGGGAAAWALSRGGARVLLLEAGPRFDPAHDYLLAENYWELRDFPHKPGSEGRPTFAPLQPLEERWSHLFSWNHQIGRHAPGPLRRPHRYHHVRGVGGSTLHFSGEAHRLNPRSMRLRSEFGVGADWPLDYAELEPYYRIAEGVLGVAGPGTHSTRPRTTPHPQPPHPLSYASQVLGRGCKALGIGWEPNPVAILSRPHAGRPACNYCANCGRGCPRGDKGSVDVTFVAQALATGRCELRTEAAASRLLTGPDDRLRGVEYIDRDGTVQRARGRRYIIACGAVETPRLLLLSASPEAPDGIGNDSGQLGRHFMETISWTSAGLHPEPLANYRGIPSDAICWDFNHPDAIPGVIGGCRFFPSGGGDLNGPFQYALRVAGGWGRRHQRRMRETFGRALSVSGLGESLPNPGSYIDLDPDERDAFGRPLARIHSRLDPMEIGRIAFMAERCRAILDAAGVTELFEEYGTYDLFSASHVFGGCRMGDNPEHSVVDRDGRSHRWRDLYVCDASTFPSSGGGEAPSLTIEALAIRTAERILHDRRAPS